MGASHPVEVRQRRLLVIRLYADISGKPSDLAMVAAGYFADEARWAMTDRRWAKVLAQAKVPYFHATDFYACRGQFKEWTLNSKRHINFGKRFSAVADDCKLIGAAYGVPIAPFGRFRQAVVRRITKIESGCWLPCTCC